MLSSSTRHNRATVRYLYDKGKADAWGRKYTHKQLGDQFGFSMTSISGILQNVYGDDLSLDPSVLEGECGSDMEEALKRENDTRKCRKIDRYAKYNRIKKEQKLGIRKAGTKTPSSANAQVSDMMYLIMGKVIRFQFTEGLAGWTKYCNELH